MSYVSAIRIPFERQKAFSFFHNIERLFRLNPQWAVLSIEGDLTFKRGMQFILNIRYDRSEQEVKYTAKLEEFIEGELLTIRLHSDTVSRILSITLRDEGNATVIEYKESSDEDISIEEKREINLWIRSIANYIMIQEKKSLFSKLWKWFLDKIWLKMTPMGRRVVLIIIFIESIALVFFFFLLIYLLIFKGF